MKTLANYALQQVDNVYVIDFETYLADDFSLSREGVEHGVTVKKMPVSAYVRSSRFQTIGVGIRSLDGAFIRWLEHADFASWCKDVNWSNTGVVCHNANFDGLILSHHYGVQPAWYACTKAMARTLGKHHAAGAGLRELAAAEELGEKGYSVDEAIGKRRADFSLGEWIEYGDYCRKDCALTAGLYQLYLPHVPPFWMRHIDLTVRCFVEPAIVMDLDDVTALEVQTRDLHREVLARAGLTMTDVRSDDRFALALERVGVYAKKMLSAKKFATYCTKQNIFDVEAEKRRIAALPDGALLANKKAVGSLRSYPFAKSSDFMVGLLASEDDEVKTLAEARAECKSSQATTRAQAFRLLGHYGKVPVAYTVAGAHTGRDAGTDQSNFTNFPKPKKGKVSLLRRALRAPPGHVFVDADSSGIEARVVAWVSGHSKLLQAFVSGADIYVDYARTAINPQIRLPKDPLASEQDAKDRHVGKGVVLGSGYQMGGPKMGVTLHTAGTLLDDVMAKRLGVNGAEWVLEEYGGKTNAERAVESRPASVPLRAWQTHLACASALVSSYRQANQPIVDFWETCQNAIPRMARGERFSFGPSGAIITGKNSLTLPSGRQLHYPNLHLGRRDGRSQWRYDGRDENTGRKKEVFMYGGKLTENIVQAMACDIVMHQAVAAEELYGYKVVVKVYDAVMVCVPETEVEEARAAMHEIMRSVPWWAQGLPLASEQAVGKDYEACGQKKKYQPKEI